MNALRLRKVDGVVAQATRLLGAGVSLAFSAQGLIGELTLRPLLDDIAGERPLTWFDSAIGPIGLSEAEAMLSRLGELPVTLGGEYQPWYWQVLNQRLSPTIMELLCPLQPLSVVNAASVANASATSAAAITCRIQLRLGDRSLHGLFSADAVVMLRLLDGRGWDLHRQPLAEDWPISQPLELGELSLSLDQLASLQAGDVLLPLRCHFDSYGNGRLPLAGRQWAVQTDRHEQQLYVRLSHEEDLGHDQ
ncbi:type III secretion system protein [Pseudomonas sp. FP1740]|uniref:type III secretion system protein n=1 Tax=Pseudomonas sp. FP1740 TaxID=2954078 RepID=UPI00273372EE|nr:type III secretion system protein [Pseudomonas sp. FP1740]WLG46830.1 type III secretion system protein [Pseudomonas sp. FP1740]